jgi:signal transduction histidine kinase
MRAKQSSTAIEMYSRSGTLTPPLPPSILTIPIARTPKRVRGAACVHAAILLPISVPGSVGGKGLLPVRQQRTNAASGCDPEVAQSEGLLHDAQNLLGAVGLYCDLLSAPGVLKPEHLRYAKELRLAGARSSALLERLNLLSPALVGPSGHGLITRPEADPACSTAKVAREDAGRVSVRPVTLRTIVDRCSGLLGQVAGGRAIEVNYGDAASVPVRVPEETIERILVNLVRNAAAGLNTGGDGVAPGLLLSGVRVASESVVIQETLDGTEDDTPGAIRIGAGLPVYRAGEPRPWPFRRVRLTVEDSGCGMTLAHLDRVLNPREAPVRGSHGMGLRVVRELVAASGGELGVMSAPGVGTRVQIDWPAAATPSVEVVEGGLPANWASILKGHADSPRHTQSIPVRVRQTMSNGRGKQTVVGIAVKARVGFRPPRMPITATDAGGRIPC